MSCNQHGESWLWSTWVKTPLLKDAEILVVSACLPVVNPELYRKLSEGKVVLFACPERENATHY
ncbi:MAG: 4Fe-4S ferredoxin, partial [Desulfurococcaceae archaeon]